MIGSVGSWNHVWVQVYHVLLMLMLICRAMLVRLETLVLVLSMLWVMVCM